MESGPDLLSTKGASAFATTHWSVVLSARNETPEDENALEALCQTYWYPIYAYVRRRGHDATAAKDLTQEFFAQLLQKQLLAGVDPTKGKFRSWLLGVMNHFLAHQWAKANAQKRGAGQPMFSWDELEAEEAYRLDACDESAPEKFFDRQWALTVLEHAAARLRQEYELAGKGALYSCLKDFVSLEGADASYEQAAQQLGLGGSAVKSAIHRLRQRYQKLLRTEIAQTVSNDRGRRDRYHGGHARLSVGGSKLQKFAAVRGGKCRA
jgi:RNA polymerase sigma-70 factor (ECF subfamily)